MTNQRLFLIGYRGSGKTTVGRLLAERVGWSFVDADVAFESRAGVSIAHLFATKSEAAFRDRESALLTEFAQLERHVIACGGGVILRADNRRLLQTNGHCVWLTGHTPTLVGRLADDPSSADRRPPLTNLAAPAEVERLLREREPLYRETAHCVVATDGRSPDEVVSAILSQWPTSPSTSP